MNEERIREEAIEILGENHYGTFDWEAIKRGDNPTVTQKEAKWIAETIDQILSIKGIRIEADNQDLPEHRENNLSDDLMYHEGQQDMLNAGFVKCLPPIKKECYYNTNNPEDGN